jgi:hypothetical protein
LDYLCLSECELASEQFAIDWIKVDREGRAFRGGGKTSEQWLCYAPGIAPSNLTIPEIAGNHVILDLGEGRYAMYAHLAPHSVTVHVGDRVRAGDKLGLLGNSGNTSGPHLHFQISDRPSTLDTTSLPFVFESMVLESRTSANLDEIENYSLLVRAVPSKCVGGHWAGLQLEFAVDWQRCDGQAFAEECKLQKDGFAPANMERTH